MRIAFDLDDTLIPGERRFDVEPLGVMGRLLGSERLRAGAPALLRRLRAERHELWVYTSSMRSPASIRLIFLVHGIWLDGVINQEIHDRVLAKAPHRHSKYSPAFGIDVLFDDSIAVRDHGRAHGFRVVLVDEGADMAQLIATAFGWTNRER